MKRYFLLQAFKIKIFVKHERNKFLALALLEMFDAETIFSSKISGLCKMFRLKAAYKFFKFSK